MVRVIPNISNESYSYLQDLRKTLRYLLFSLDDTTYLWLYFSRCHYMRRYPSLSHYQLTQQWLLLRHQLTHTLGMVYPYKGKWFPHTRSASIRFNAQAQRKGSVTRKLSVRRIIYRRESYPRHRIHWLRNLPTCHLLGTLMHVIPTPGPSHIVFNVFEQSR